MTTRESILLFVRWGSKFIIDPCLYRFETVWLRNTTVRELLVHVLTEVSPYQNYEMKYIPYKRGVLRTSFPLWGVTVL